MFPLPLLVIVAFAPSSPWWLVRRGRREEAIKAMERLSDHTVDQHQAVAQIEHTVSLEKQLQFGASYADLFRGVNRRRTEIAVIAWCSQTFTACIIQGYQSYFFTQACVGFFPLHRSIR
jgi:SP family general alpha glucoside:H+ symporter-like MFS transporter